ncbi:E3 ubiquitin-protein ligase XIAP-like isoform X2 [Oncorhynchus keta]|uniref:E3 ubiquitin-protein ligase XIAP-like isoform X2 n=1 Tax=Oncorhynchus keta TaxID=8018 RepID=UPI0015FDE43B|nr:E3 ubiquitin-protein ligase XIAP-like isoform X2 [Oncorhynchus keta]
MSGPGRDSDLESDHAVDWSMMDMRLDSFRGSPLAQQVSSERLARAGFYFTGQADKVRCFSCHKTVENWRGGDAPVERHAEVSPSCKFLSCTHRSRVNSLQGAMLTNETSYNEDAEDMEFRLRTGEVVDDTTYPMAPHMASEDSRFNTFGPWPSTSPVRPRELAQAGLFYLGEGDQVQCFCCGRMLKGWEAGDTAWGEHSKHYPYCFFILGHDVGNLPSQRGREVEETRPCLGPRVPMQSFEERLGSFAGIQHHPIDHERLARAGFYNTGAPDHVGCFRCGGGLKGWQQDEDPWEEHAKHYPGCSFLLAEKGQEFVSSVQLQGPGRNNAASSHLNGCSSRETGCYFQHLLVHAQSPPSLDRGAAVSQCPEGGGDGSGACLGREDNTGEDTQGWDRLLHPGNSAAGLL